MDEGIISSIDAGSLQTGRDKTAPIIPSGVLAMLIFVAAEIMFFAALISAFLIIKSGALFWPPPMQPRLPVATTAFNTCILLLSGWLTYRANRSFSRSEMLNITKKLLGLSILLGAFFVLFQGYEWLRLIHFGLTMTSSPYGSFFYLIIGAHGLHALAALLILTYVYFKLKRSRLASSEFWTAQVFWYFVVGVWPVLYILVYLT